MKTRIKILLLAVGTVLAVQAQLPREIVFSDQPLNPESAQNLKKDFKAGEHIYAVAYITDAVKNLYHPFCSELFTI